MRRVSALAAVAALVATLGSAPPQSSDQAMTVLRSAINAPNRLSYVAQVQLLRFGAQKASAAIFRLEHRAPNLSRRWYLAPQDLYGDSIISRGETTYSIDVKRERVVVAQDDAIDDQVAEDDNFSVLEANYVASFAPDEKLDGRACRVIVLTNKYTGQVTMRVHVDAATNLVLEKQTYAQNGSLLGDTRVDHLNYTPNIPIGIFELPRGYTRVNGPARSLPSSDLASVIRSAGFKALSPKDLPEGFTPVEGDVISIKGVRTLHLLYSDGIRNVSLFQNQQGSTVDMSHYRVDEVKFEDATAQYVEEGPITLFTWSQAGLHFTMVGELNVNEMVSIAKSVVP